MELAIDSSRPGREILADFAAFADPNTELASSATDGMFKISWMRDDEARVVDVGVDDDGEPTTVLDGGVELGYAAYFASSRMADLPQLARTILRSMPVSSPFVVPRLKHGGAIAEDARQELLARLSEPSPVTKLLFLTGDAGAGKSQLLTSCTRLSAEQYLINNSGSLLLYVNAQGRGLARLTEALAAETQDLRSKFTYHAVARLARIGLLQVVIDGFDELIGGQGTYEDAFGSLASFVEELAGHGALVAAARSVYFEQEFLSRVDASAALGGALWSLTPLEVAPWGDQEVREYARQFTSQDMHPEKDAAYAALVDRLLSDDMKALRSKPFFVAKICELFGETSSTSGDPADGLTGEVVQAYVRREVQSKLVDSSGAPYLTARQFTQLLEEVAEEMWRQETREIHARGLRELFDLFAEIAEISEIHRRLLWEQATARALLRPGRKPMTVTFEHELFFGYFLATYLSDVLHSRPQAIADALSRGNVPVDAAQQVFQRAESAGMDLPRVLKSMEAAYARTPRALSLVRQNVGTLTVEMLKALPRTERLRVAGCIVGVADTSTMEVAEVDFSGVEFRRSDLRGTRFLSCTFTNCQFVEVKVSRETEFMDSSIQLEDCIGLIFDDGGDLRSLYSPQEVGAVLRDLGAMPKPAENMRKIPAPYLEVVGLLNREFRRANMISSDPESYPKILNHEGWPIVLEALLTEGLLHQERRAASGRKKLFYRRTFAPEQLLAGLQRTADVPESITRFWNVLEGVGPRPR